MHLGAPAGTTVYHHCSANVLKPPLQVPEATADFDGLWIKTMTIIQNVDIQL